jgi:energy-coupling factor transport system permease protein
MNRLRKDSYKPEPAIVKGFFPDLTYMDNDSRLHRLHPLVKLVFLISFSLTVFLVPSCTGEIILFSLLLAGFSMAGQRLLFFVQKLRFILIFGLLILIVQVLSVKEGFLLWQLWRLSVWSEGLISGLTIMLRFINIIGSSYLFVVTTDPNRLSYSLMQMGLPYRFGFMLITALRFIPVFRLELEQVKNAQMAKGIDMEGLSPRKLIKAVKYLFVPLVISALSKVDSLTISMESRAFGLYPARSYMYSQTLSPKEIVCIIAVPVVFLTLCLVLR